MSAALHVTICTVALTLVACHVRPTIPLPATVEISDELSADDVEATLSAVDDWNSKVKGIITRTVMRHTPSKREGTIFVRRGKPETATSDAHSKTTFCRSTAFIEDRSTDVVVAVAHEFGHAFGLDDNMDTTSIMGAGATINDDDAAAARGALRHRHKHHKACENKEWLGVN